MKKRLAIILSIVLVFTLFVSVSCKKKATQEDYDQVVPLEDTEGIDSETGINLLPEGNGVSFAEEGDTADLHYTKKDASEFIGEWVAPSDMAAHLYGNLDLTVNEDHTWTANITEEDYNGTWEESKTGLKMNGDRFSFSLDFDDGGNLILTEKADDGDLHTVLTRK